MRVKVLEHAEGSDKNTRAGEQVSMSMGVCVCMYVWLYVCQEVRGRQKRVYENI